MSGFIQAAAFTIPLGQLKKIFGVHVDGQTFFTKADFRDHASELLCDLMAPYALINGIMCY